MDVQYRGILTNENVDDRPMAYLTASEDDQTNFHANCEYFGFFDASNGIEEIPEWGGDQVDHGHEGCGVTVTPGASECRLEETVEAL
jgi:hypothetical protein